MKIIKYDNMKIKLPFKLSSTECGDLTNEQIKVQYVPTHKLHLNLTLPRFANGVYLATLNAKDKGNKTKAKKGADWLKEYFPYTALMLNEYLG
tara:strand:- start:3141 stop:3419 length:279 start_codon:yes stop_codon:yes gene_type:complete